MNFEKYVNKVPYVNRKDDADGYARYQEGERKAGEDFKKDLLEELGVTGHPKADKLFSLAWSYGHSSGYSEVFSYASEFVDLLS